MDGELCTRGHWQRALLSSQEWRGYFLISDPGLHSRQIRGRLRRRGSSEVEVYLEHPPRGGRYEHEACLQYLSGGWFKLHFTSPPRSFEAAIVFTEHFLACCLAGQETR